MCGGGRVRVGLGVRCGVVGQSVRVALSGGVVARSW
jgi:hypothetical protein